VIGGKRRCGDGKAGSRHQGDICVPQRGQQRAVDPIALLEIAVGRHPEPKPDDHAAIGEIMHTDLRTGLSIQAGDGGDGIAQCGDGFIRVFLITDGDPGFDDALFL
jgi:hypothetical protein